MDLSLVLFLAVNGKGGGEGRGGEEPLLNTNPKAIRVTDTRSAVENVVQGRPTPGRLRCKRR